MAHNTTSASTIYVSTACLRGTEEMLSRLEAYAQVGIEAVELGARIRFDSDAFQRVCDMDGHYLIHNYFPPPPDPFFLNLASDTPTIHQCSQELVSNAIDLSVKLNAPFYSFHAGFVTDPSPGESIYFDFPEPQAGDAQRALDRFVTTLSTVHARHAGKGIDLLIENNVCHTTLVGKQLLVDPEGAAQILEQIDPDLFGILLDFGHLNVSAHTLGFDRMDFIDRFAPFIRGFHVHDNDGIDDLHLPIQPGSWVHEVLCHQEFAHVPLVVEAICDDISELAHHVDWLRTTLGRV